MNETVGVNASATVHGHHGPIVQGQTNQIELRFRENTFFAGSLYMGSDHVVSKVVFDTRTKWTGVILANAVNADNPSRYALEDSGTQIAYQPRGKMEDITLKQA